VYNNHDSGRRVSDALIASLKADGYEIARDDPAEILLAGHVEYTPTIRLGSKDSPYDVADSLAACRARLNIQLISLASEEILITAAAEGSGRSFTGDFEARAASAESAADNLILKARPLLRDNLLVRWVRERQEGHTVTIRVAGLSRSARDQLQQDLAAMRGFRRIVSESAYPGGYQFRLLTRLDIRGIRRRLKLLTLANRAINVHAGRGPMIACSLGPPIRVTGRQ
jgi:hypothetical protein